MAIFEWDEAKNRSNLAKHRVDFEEAKSIFDDSNSLEKPGNFRGEPRVIRLGKSATKLILIVVYTMRRTVTRIISARQASRSERNVYIDHKLSNSSTEDES